MSGSPSFLDELRRRKVVRVALVYGAVAWALVQVADVFVPALRLPAWIVTAVAFVAVLGFPLALGLAWAFDVTPEGLKRTGGAVPDASGRPARAWLSFPAVGAAAVLLGVGWSAGSLLDGARPGEGTSTASDRHSIAVLPLRDLGATEDETNFADGVHDDILTQPHLRLPRDVPHVRGALRGTDLPVPEIAEALGVAVVLEGGIQRTDGRVRMNVQLIDGGTDEHLWAETFDRELSAENVFQIQSEIARAVAEALQAELTTEEEARLAEVPTHDLVALELYYRANRLFEESDNQNSPMAIALLENAVARDPGFVRAWVDITRLRAWELRRGQTLDTLPSVQAVGQVERLAPGSAEATAARAWYRYYARADYRGALDAFRSIPEAARRDPDTALGLAALQRRVGDYEGGVATLRAAIEASPADWWLHFQLGAFLTSLGRLDAAEAAQRRAAELAPDVPVPVATGLVNIAVVRGDTARLAQLVDTIAARWPQWESLPWIRAYLTWVRRGDLGTLPDPEGSHGSGDYFTTSRIVDSPASVLTARMAWSGGDRERAKRLAGRFEEDQVRARPVLAQDSLPIPPGEDFFGLVAARRTTRAWEAAFTGRPAEALAEADRAVELLSVEDDAMDGSFILEQRALVRIVAGDHAGAVEDLERLLRIPEGVTEAELRLEPIYDPLRSRADFQALISGSAR